jgi:hypothetical protein
VSGAGISGLNVRDDGVKKRFGVLDALPSKFIRAQTQ